MDSLSNLRICVVLLAMASALQIGIILVLFSRFKTLSRLIRMSSRRMNIFAIRNTR